MNSERIQELKEWYGPASSVDERCAAIVELCEALEVQPRQGYETPAFDPATAQPVEACLMQLMQATASGDLISKSERDWLIDAGLATCAHGFNMITPKGIMYLLDLGLIHA